MCKDCKKAFRMLKILDSFVSVRISGMGERILCSTFFSIRRILTCSKNTYKTVRNTQTVATQKQCFNCVEQSPS
jgi:hypothetical protein